jgi:hypothetical protein
VVDPGAIAAIALVAFAGGAVGAALGALPAFSFAGLVIVVGEAVRITGGVADVGGLETLGAGGITGSIGLGPALGPHVAFAGGIAATAYAADRGYMDTGFDYHEAKNVTYALGTRTDVLAVGGLFGVVGVAITRGSVAFSLPWDPIALSIVLSAFLHRIAFGYPLIGDVRDGLLDMSPFERGERRAATVGDRAVGSDPDLGADDDADSGVIPEEPKRDDARFVVEPWLPHQYRWSNVALLGAVVGIFSAFVTYETGSPFLGFGITAASLVFLNLGMEKTPITHHMAFPAGIIVVGLAGAADPSLADGSPFVDPGAIATVVPLVLAVVAGGAIGLVAGLVGELIQRVFYAHADTHLDPPAAAIVVATLLIAVLDAVGVLAQDVVPTLGL